MQHLKAGLFPEIGHKILVVHISRNYEDRGPYPSQGKGSRMRRLPAAAVMQVSATGYEIGINSPQPLQPGPAVVKVREPYDPEWSAKTCQSYSSPHPVLQAILAFRII